MASELVLVWLPSGECKGVGNQPRNMDVITRNSMKKGGGKQIQVIGNYWEINRLQQYLPIPGRHLCSVTAYRPIFMAEREHETATTGNRERVT